MTTSSNRHRCNIRHHGFRRVQIRTISRRLISFDMSEGELQILLEVKRSKTSFSRAILTICTLDNKIARYATTLRLSEPSDVIVPNQLLDMEMDGNE